MPPKVCRYPGCSCKEGLAEVTTEEEAFCRALCNVQFAWPGFKRVADNGIYKAKTWLCPEHTPKGLAEADVLGRRVAKFGRVKRPRTGERALGERCEAARRRICDGDAGRSSDEVTRDRSIVTCASLLPTPISVLPSAFAPLAADVPSVLRTGGRPEEAPRHPKN